jgi:hypothetical protein
MVDATDLSSGWPAVHALDNAGAGELWALAGALEVAGGVFAVFAPAIGSLATTRELGIEPDDLAELNMRTALRRARVRLEGDPGARARLEAADEPFWVAVRDAVEPDGAS